MSVVPKKRTLARAGLIPMAFIVLLSVAGCGGGGKATGSSAGSKTPSDFDFGANSAVRATAFGDSITLGVLGDTPDGRVLVTGNNYPNNLQAMLKGLDTAWRVFNRGVGGERTPQGAARLPGVLAADRSGFVLIMEGTNDADREDDPAFIVANLQQMVGQARGNRTVPVIGTIAPNFRNDPSAQSIITQANAMIRTMAQTQRVVLAEIFSGMNDRSLFGTPERGIPDPLHPNERGYSLMAGIWFSAMQQAIPPPPAPSPGTDVKLLQTKR